MKKFRQLVDKYKQQARIYLEKKSQEERKINKQKNTIIAVSSIFLLLAGFNGWPYDFFVLLKFIVFVSGVYLAWLAYKTKQEKWIWAYGIIAILFNPFFSLHFSRSAWTVIDIATAIFLIISGFLFRPAKSLN
ncbi:MAG: hypothetical protein NT170_03660 [Candidatus Moranbacteria bacterium]|nr:hypothetical protein [Candidatus Moranbacteria bacterium]